MLTGGKRRRQALIQLHARPPGGPAPARRAGRTRRSRRRSRFSRMADLAWPALGDRGGARRGGRGGARALAADRERGRRGLGLSVGRADALEPLPRRHPERDRHRLRDPGARARARQALDRGDFARPRGRGARWVQDALFVRGPRRLRLSPGQPDRDPQRHPAGRTRGVDRARPATRASSPPCGAAVERTLAAQQPDGSFPYGEGPGWSSWTRSTRPTCSSASADLREVDPRGRAAARARLRLLPAPLLRRARAGAAVARAGVPGGRPLRGQRADHAVPATRERAWPTRTLHRARGRRVPPTRWSGGHAIHRRYRWGPTRVRYVRWADAHMALGLAAAAALAAQR